MQRNLIALILLLTAGCARTPHSTATNAPNDDAAFNQLADDYLAGYLAWRPQAGTSLGFHQYKTAK